MVVVIEIDQPPQLQMSRQRRGFRCNALHQITVSYDGINVMIEQIWQVSCSKVRLRNRHSDTCCKALTKWTGCGLDSRRQSVLRMTRRSASPLTKVVDLFERKIITG